MGTMRQIYRFISSMKTGLALLFITGLAAAAGASLWPGTFFKTPLFKLLLLLLLLNMILCTVNRLKGAYGALLKGAGFRFWFRQTGILLLHLGMTLILLGGAIDAARGQEHTIRLFSGDRVDISRMLDIKHPFALRLNEFRIDFNADRSPSQYVSEVTVLERGQEIKDVSISVNNPLNHEGVRAYQSSFGYLIKVQYTDQSGAEQTVRCTEGDLLAPAGTNRVVKVYRYLIRPMAWTR